MLVSETASKLREEHLALSAVQPLADLALEDELIILQLVDGTADTTVAHLPAATRGGQESQIRWADYDAPPVTWQSACRQIIGPVYNRGGVLEHIDICPDCEEAA